MPITSNGQLILSYTPTVGPNAGKRQRWRAHVDTYFVPRAADPQWRARAGLPERRTALTIPEHRRFTLPVAEQDWAAWCLGSGPDPKTPPVRSVARGTRAVDLIEQWWTKTDRAALKSCRDVHNRVGQLARWLGDRPAEDLLRVETYDALRGWCLARGAKTQADGLVASVLRPVVLWALDVDLLTGKSPFGRHRVRVAKSNKRKRVITREEEAAIRDALAADGRPDAARLRAFLTGMAATACRPVELALLQVWDVGYRRRLIAIPPRR